MWLLPKTHSRPSKKIQVKFISDVVLICFFPPTAAVRYLMRMELSHVIYQCHSRS